jgi:hypothetical protein
MSANSANPHINILGFTILVHFLTYQLIHFIHAGFYLDFLPNMIWVVMHLDHVFLTHLEVIMFSFFIECNAAIVPMMMNKSTVN